MLKTVNVVPKGTQGESHLCLLLVDRGMDTRSLTMEDPKKSPEK